MISFKQHFVDLTVDMFDKTDVIWLIDDSDLDCDIESKTTCHPYK